MSDQESPPKTTPETSDLVPPLKEVASLTVARLKAIKDGDCKGVTALIKSEKPVLAYRIRDDGLMVVTSDGQKSFYPCQ